MEKRSCSKVWAIVVIAIALIVAILASVWPQERLADIIYITRFFDVTLPILAFGALVKYICCGKGSCCCNTGKCDQK